MTDSALLIRAVPYLVALVLTTSEIPSKLLTSRHRQVVDQPTLDFASRWNKVAELVGYPFLILFYALSEIGELFRYESGTVVSAWLMLGGFVYAVLVFMALWLSSGELNDRATLPTLRVFRWKIPFDGLVLCTKVGGVLFPAVLDLWLRSRVLLHTIK
jgi:hypothetical protein